MNLEKFERASDLARRILDKMEVIFSEFEKEASEDNNDEWNIGLQMALQKMFVRNTAYIAYECGTSQKSFKKKMGECFKLAADLMSDDELSDDLFEELSNQHSTHKH